MSSDAIPTFSVILPTHNRRAVLERSINSLLLDQTYSDLELVVVDDGSTDDTEEFLDGISDPRLVRVTTGRLGPSGARNAGAEVATGKLITFLDSDDEARPNWLATFFKQFSEDDMCALVCCGALHIIAPDGRREVKMPWKRGPEYESCVGLFIPGCYCVRRDIFDEVGGFASELPYGEHHELALRLVPNCVSRGLHIRSVDRIGVIRHRDNPRDRLRRYRSARYRGATYILNTHGARLARNRALMSNYLANAGVSAAALGKRSEARKLILRAIRMNPRNRRHYMRLVACLSRKVAQSYW